MRKMRKMRNCAQLIFDARKMRKFAPTRKPVALETLYKTLGFKMQSLFLSSDDFRQVFKTL